MQVLEAVGFGLPKKLATKLQGRSIEAFTSAQKLALEAGLCQGKNLLVCAPTSSGKTLIAEIAAVQGALRGFRSIYLVSHRALAEEKYKLFLREYAPKKGKWFDVGIATGDRAEGEWEQGILVATYEKYLAMLCASGNFDLSGQVVIADEIQILGEENRGAEIELLTTLVRRGRPQQLIALSATIKNAPDVAAWLNCVPVIARERDVPLYQQILYEGTMYQNKMGDAEVFEGDKSNWPSSTLEAVDRYLKDGKGPILVFTTTKPRAILLAEEYSKSKKRHAKALAYAEQLDLFTEPSALARTLGETSQKGVAFHTADLSFNERSVVELGLNERMFDVVFATPTLAAGVNFPFQTVIFDSFYRKFIPNRPWLPQSDYNNMAGRAGRLGLHEQGYAVLLPQGRVEYEKAIELATSPVSDLESTFLNFSLRKMVLTMYATKAVSTRKALVELFEDTLWWYQTREENARKLARFPESANEATDYLLDERLIIEKAAKIVPTRLGVAVSATGLLPQSAAQLLKVVRENESAFELTSQEWIPQIIHCVCGSDEFGEGGQRFLPYARNNQPDRLPWSWIQGKRFFLENELFENAPAVINSTYALCRWIEGEDERILRSDIPSMTYGQVQRLAADVAWILDGLMNILRIPEVGVDPIVPNLLRSLSDRLRFGVPAHLVGLVKAAERAEVPGFGRQRAMKLNKAGICSPNDVLKTDKRKLLSLLENEERVNRLLQAIVEFFDMPMEVWRARHVLRAKEIGVDPRLVEASYDKVGDAYEEPVGALLSLVEGIKVTQLDKNKRQGMPDFSIEYEGYVIILECKTKVSGDATLDKEAAFAVLTKACDITKHHCVTLGKPDFDDFSKDKVGGGDELTLVRHQDFIDAILRLLAGSISTRNFIDWLMFPGFIDVTTLKSISIKDPSAPLKS